MTTNVATTAPPPAAIPGPVKFLFGGLAGMGATLFVQPLDLVKNRMQLSGMAGKREYKSSVHALRSIVAKEGFFALYNGLSAGLARQATYTTTRLGIYSWLFERFSTPGVAGPSFALKAVLGMSAGGVASIVGNPMELALVRMTADGRLPPAERRNYKNVFDALFRVTREEGVLTLWRGCTPTVIRAMVVNAAQLATYSQAKQQLVASFNFKEGIPLHFCASMVSGFATTVASMPVDIVKTRIQNMRVIDGKPEFSGVFDVVRRIIGNEGFFALWKGFFPYYFRLGPHTLKMRLRKEERKSASTERAAANTSSSEALKVPKTEPSVEGNDQPTQQQQPPQANLDPNAACYCGAPRVLGGLEVCCDTCKRWFHQSCFRNLENFGGLPFMVSYKFQCQNCSQDGTEKWNIRSTNHSSMTVMALANMTLNYLKKQDEPADVKANPFFDVESEIAEYMEKNWEYLSTGARPKKKNWHLTILKILQKETELFVQDPERPTAFALKERDLFRIGPMHESVVQLFKRGRDAAVEREANALQIGEQQLNSLVEGGGLAEGPKTRGASKRKAAAANVTLTISDRSTESSPKPAGTPSGGAAGAPPAAKKSKTAADFATVQIEGGQATVDFPFNREGYRYYLVERDPNIPNRERFDTEEVNNTRAVQIPGHIYRIVIPSVVTLSPNDRANQLLLDADCLTVMGNEGYSMVRATHPVSHGAWYYEMEFLNQPGDSHVRVGWAQSFSVLQACVGYSKFTYGMRSKHGTAFHDGYGRHYATGGFRQGDVVGCLIELPPLEETSSARCPISEVLPASRKDRDLIKFKQNHFFEEKEEPQQALQKLKPLPNSKIEFFINGKSCGPAFTDIYEGHYFPAVSLFQSARVRMNFGPNFRCAPEKVRSGQVRAMSERPQQMHIEQAVADMLHMVVNEAELEQKNADYFDAILAKDQQQSVQPPATTNNAVQQ